MVHNNGTGAARPLSRRFFLTATGIGALTAGLAACGGTSTSGSSPSSPAPTSGGGGGFPLTMEGAEGKTVLTARPQRVVTVGFMRDLDEAVSLGVNPVATTPASNFDSGIPPWVEAKLGGAKIEQLEFEDKLPFEKIVALTPDLILATDSYTLADDFANLTALAPTLSYEKDVAEDTWQTRATRVGKALGKSDEAEKAVKAVTAKIEEAKTKNQAALAGKTFTFSLLNGEGAIATVILPTDASAQLLAHLGLKLSDKVTKLPQAGPAGRAVVATENTDLLDADIVMFSFRNAEERAKVEGDRLFQNLPAVKRGAYVALEVETALSMAFPSTLSIPYALDKIVPLLVQAAGKA
ncbi:Putative ABC transporter, periplasmic iron-siderophore binding protein precursor [Alloactinosynnema sp. L-07]|uniref:ABC transporter substrate-binding protein n=1 Tax=Alloactinosynnema sp. L-07 TaxID=1653480 RepID=UPI00065F002F|nr:ABC transporter substrate-binding protein [Alloactinosynnema sp. L-07]CRK56689.1 Putative ABC transporter, periplasmic iron-siderophore binding protein precursor [Alloactinosynnema sp. L-07]